jgi:hypothetical protein
VGRTIYDRKIGGFSIGCFAVSKSAFGEYTRNRQLSLAADRR